MNKWLIKLGLSVAFLGTAHWGTAQAKLEPVFRDNTYQLTGVAVSKSGRMFVNYPYWSDTYKYALVEVMKDGSTKP